MDDERLTFKEMCAAFDVTPRTLRYYEYIELLQPHREGRSRFYGPRERARMKLILRGRNLGFSLAEVRRIMELYDAEPGELGQLDYLLERIAARRAELLEKRQQIDDVLAELDGLEQNCRADRAALVAKT